jgi:hypothetical protein
MWEDFLIIIIYARFLLYITQRFMSVCVCVCTKTGWTKLSLHTTNISYNEQPGRIYTYPYWYYTSGNFLEIYFVTKLGVQYVVVVVVVQLYVSIAI